MRIYYSVGIDDVDITETKGYTQILKKPCDDSCHHPIHGCLCNKGRIIHTISFTPSRREKGKFVSPYEARKIIKNNCELHNKSSDSSRKCSTVNDIGVPKPEFDKIAILEFNR